MLSHQTLRRLVYFAAIADAGSIRGAASRLNLSVPVLSEALSELEAELGVSLATRTTRRFELTAAGMKTQDAAQRILDVTNDLAFQMSGTQSLQGTLSLTLPVEIAGFWLPDKIRAFRNRHPDVDFTIDVSDDVLDLRASKTEIAVRTHYLAPHETAGSTAPIPLVVVANRPAEVSDSGSVDMALIDSSAERKLSAIPKGGGPTLPLTFTRTDQISNRLAALQLARMGLGAVMVMKGSVADELEAGTLFEILPDHDFGSIELRCHFRDRLPSPTALAFAAESGLTA